jgi:hypothetical protein
MVGASRLHSALVAIEGKCREQDVTPMADMVAGLVPIWHDTSSALPTTSGSQNP